MKRNLGKIEDFADRKITIRDVDGTSVGIFRDGEEFSAMLNICPHRAAPVCQGLMGGTMLPSGPGEEVLTTAHDHYATHESLRLAAELPGELGTLSQACSTKGMALGDQTSGRVDDRAFATICNVAISHHMMGLAHVAES